MDTEVGKPTEMQFQINEALEDPEWDSFVSSVQSGHHVQTSLWAQVKNVLGWKPLHITCKDHNAIVLGLQMLVRTIPLLGKVGYVTKGPVYSFEDPDLMNALIVCLLNESKRQGIKFVAIQPPNDGEFLIDILKTNGFRTSSLELAPSASIIINLSLDEEELFAQLNPGTRYNIRLGLRKGITTHEGGVDSLKSFYALHVFSSKRQNFLPYPYEYFATLQRTFEPLGHFKILIAEFQGQPISAMLLIPFRDTVINKLYGWSGQFRELKPNDVLYWAAIQWAKNHGYRFFDMEGVEREGANCILRGDPLPEHLVRSPYHYKYKFGGKITLFPQGFDLVLYPPYRWVYQKLNFNKGAHSTSTRVLDIIRKR